MGNNGYKNQLNPNNLYQRSSFLPMLCRLSIKDVRLSQLKDCSSSFSEEPSSPKVSCIGQVKRNNKVIGFPTPYRLNNSSATSSTTTTPVADVASGPRFHPGTLTRQNFWIRHSPSSKITSISQNHIKYTKLKKFFSSKNLIASSMTTSSNKEIFKRGVAKKQICKNSDGCGGAGGGGEVNIHELDPPLPVVKKVQPPGGSREEVNLWKRRRFGGAALRGLQIDQINQLPNNNCLPPTTV